MKIKKIHIDGFGKLHDFEITPGDGITVFFGYNEAGKTTLHLFIRSILYGASVKKRVGTKSIYERMRPWRQPSVYRGRMEIEHEQQTYLIERDFNKAADDLSIYALKNGTSEPVPEPREFLKQILNGLSETAYINTVSSGQLSAATQKDMAAELRKYTANVSGTMNPDIDSEKALRELRNRKNRLIAETDEDAAKNYTAVLGEIRKIEEALEQPENDNKINLYSDAVKKVDKDAGILHERMSYAQSELDTFKGALKQTGFVSESDINSVSRYVEEEYDKYKEAESKAYNSTAVLPSVLGFTVAIILLAVGMIVFKGMLRILAFAAAAACIAAAAANLVRVRGMRNDCEALKTNIKETLAQYIGKAEPDESSMFKFRQYIENARTISCHVDSAKQRQDKLNREKSRLSDEKLRFINSLENQQQTKSRVEAQLTKLNELKKQAAGLQRIIKQNSVLRENIEALELAEETITELSADIKNAAGTYINEEAAKIVAVFTNNAYNSISAGVNYDVQLNSPDGMVSISDMSAGTADQIYLAVRFATIRYIAGESDPMPLILDDSFNLFDDRRLAASLKFLSESYRGQILIFTCQTREEEEMSLQGINFNKINM
ncbi:MAG: AAA family ATPase [Eubacteriales bacterium]|nr:AAA family ATPase [Eubacteriales bacterium]